MRLRLESSAWTSSGAGVRHGVRRSPGEANMSPKRVTAVLLALVLIVAACSPTPSGGGSPLASSTPGPVSSPGGTPAGAPGDTPVGSAGGGDAGEAGSFPG